MLWQKVIYIEHKHGVKDIDSAYQTIEDGIEYGKGAPL